MTPDSALAKELALAAGRLLLDVRADFGPIEAGDKAAARAVYQTAVSTLDSIADKKIYHKNKAARPKSRLSAAIKAMA